MRVLVFNKQSLFHNDLVFIRTYLETYPNNATYHDDDNGGGDHGKDDPRYAVERGETTIVLLKTDTLPSV